MKFAKYNVQPQLKDQLLAMFRNNHVPHAQIFLGESGYGSLYIAIAFAQYLNCENPGQEDSCGTCNSCLKYEKLIHPDLHFIFPTSGGDKVVSDDFIEVWRESVINNPFFSLEDWYDYMNSEKQGYIGVSESASLIRKINYKTFEGRYKVFVIWMAEYMNAQSANKLLKILEEPPEDTLFLLIAENTDRILPTIISRAQLLRFSPVNINLVESFLFDKTQDINLSKEKANVSRGNINKAIKALNTSEKELLFFIKFKELMRLAYKPDLEKMLVWAEEIAAFPKESQKGFIDYSINLIRNNFIKSETDDEKLLFLNSEESEFSALFSKFIKKTNTPYIMNEFNKVYEHILFNANPKILFTDMVLKTAILFKK